MKRFFLFLLTAVCVTVSSANEVSMQQADTMPEEVCEKDLPFLWHQQFFSFSGTYYDTVFSGEDTTIYVLELTILQSSKSMLLDTVCLGNSYDFNEITLQNIEPGSYEYVDTLVNYLGCDSIVTLRLTVLDTVAKPIVYPASQTLCESMQPDSLVASNNYDLRDDVSYQWYVSNDGAIWHIIPGATLYHHQPSQENSDRYFKISIFSKNGCGSVESDPVLVSIYEKFHAGTISLNDNPTILCRNDRTVNALSGSLPTGGSNSYSYQWQESDSTGDNWVDIGGATDISLPAQQCISHKTYFRRIDKDNICQVYDTTTEVVVIDVYQSPTKPVLAPYTDSVCYGGIPHQLNVAMQSLGYSPEDGVIYEWEYSDDGQRFYTLGTTGLTYSPQSILVAPRWYRVKAVLVSGCDSVYSDAIVVNVYDPLDVQVTSGSTTVCYESSTVLSVSASGADSQYSYQWYQSSDMGILETLIGTNSTLSTPAKTGGTCYYRCVVTSTQGCSDTSGVITVTTRPKFNAGSISFSGDSIVCPDSVFSNPFVSDSPASGGSNSYAYQWQYMINENWISIPGENQLTLSKFDIETTIYFRRLDIDVICNETIPSNVKMIDIFRGLSKPKLSQHSSTVCYDSVPTGQLFIVDLSVPVSPEDSVTYSWEYTSDLRTDFYPLNVHDIVYGFTENLTDTTYYRVVASLLSGCGKQISDTIRVCVYDQLRVSNISGETAICNNSSTNLSVTASGVDGMYDYQWYRTSTPNVSNSWVPVGENNRTYETEAQTSAGTLYYKCQVMSRSGCGTVSSSYHSVETKLALNAGEIEGNDTICFNTNGYRIISKTPSSGSFSSQNYYKWQKAGLSEENWIDIPNETSASLVTSDTLRQSTRFHRVAYNSICNLDEKPSNIVTIYVRDPITAPVINNPVEADSICYGGGVTLSMSSRPSDGQFGEQFSFEWYDKTTTTGTLVYTGETLELNNLTQDRDYFVKAVSSRGCEGVSSASVHIHVMKPLKVSITGPDSTLCYNTGDVIKASASGSVKNAYHYVWQQTTDTTDSNSWVTVPKSSDAPYMNTPERTDGKPYYYRCIVSDSYCILEKDTSNIMQVNTFEQIVPGTLKQLDAIGYCQGTKVDTLTFDTKPEGGYQTIVWQYRKKGSNSWIDLPTVSSIDLKYDLNQVDSILTDTVYVHAKLKNVCQTDSTPEIEVKINPLPAPSDISTDTNLVCSNDIVTYSIPEEKYRDGCYYTWNSNDNGHVVRQYENKVEIQWTEESDSSIVSLTITDTLTGCSIECEPYIQKVRQGIDSVKIFRKRGSNILYCKECDTTLYYQWQRYANGGNTSNAEDVDYGQGKRYIVVKNENDLDSYTYCLKLTKFPKTDSAQCSSYNEFRGGIDTTAYKRGTNKIYASTYIHDIISIRIENPDKMPTDLAVYSVSGILLYTMSLGDEEYIVEEIPVTLLPGVYFLNVKIGSEISTIKLMAE